VNNFDFLENTFTKRIIPFSLDEKESVYMLNRWGSMHPLSFTAAVFTNKYSSKLPKFASEALFFHKVRKSFNIPQFSYLKNDGKEKVNEEAVKKLMKYFHCSKLHAVQILNIYTKDKINIYHTFGIKEK
jgi:hypothetical protein